MNKELLIKELEKVGWHFNRVEYSYLIFANKFFTELWVSFEYKDIYCQCEEECSYCGGHEAKELDFQTICILSDFIKNN